MASGREKIRWSMIGSESGDYRNRSAPLIYDLLWHVGQIRLTQPWIWALPYMTSCAQKNVVKT